MSHAGITGIAACRHAGMQACRHTCIQAYWHQRHAGVQSKQGMQEHKARMHVGMHACRHAGM